MKNFKIYFFVFAIFLIAVFFVSCSPMVYTTKYAKDPLIQLAPNVDSKQTIGDITIELQPIDQFTEYKKSMYKQMIPVTFTPSLSNTPVTEPKEFLIAIWAGLIPFNVTIYNNTDHILKMKDARVLYIDPDSDEPLIAMDKMLILADLQNIPVFKFHVGSILKEYPQTNPLELNANLQKACMNIINQTRFINGFNMEIMPGMKITGTLIFPVSPEKISYGKVSFIDMVSKTDAAGNPVEKVRFDFKTQLSYIYTKYDYNKKTWINISENEYNKGLINPEKFTYDKNLKKYISVDN